MEVVSVIVTNRHEGTVVSVESKIVPFDGKDREEKVAEMEKLFVSKCIASGIDEEEAEDCLDDGYMELDESELVSIVWS